MHTFWNESQADRGKKTKKLNKIEKNHFYTRMAKYCTTPRVNVEPAAMQGVFFSVKCGQEWRTSKTMVEGRY